MWKTRPCAAPVPIIVTMAKPAYFSRHIVLAGSILFGVLLALGIHIIIQRFNLNLGDLWRTDVPELIPARAALAWWLIGAVAFRGHVRFADEQRRLGRMSLRLRQFLIGRRHHACCGGTGRLGAKSDPDALRCAGWRRRARPGAVMAFCGAQFALRRS
jgi:hypothetical protein